MDAANIKKQTLVSGFKTTGIYPFNPYEVYKKLPEYEDEIKYDVDQILLDCLKENKYPNPIKRGKNTKVTVPSGKSMSSADISSTINQKVTINRNTTLKKSLATVTERIQHQSSETKQSKTERQPNKTLSKKVDSKQKPFQKEKRVVSTSDSESSL
ncbi:unnamed protein product [Parnassius apollo]|uniref:(apollo) hypothetical protein n=1 Tax=Parnassius apollo TaxID=110799 RepID=A0A8S3X0Y3_PARAO|nr:unnamed protein product [Parnassius apollo]